MSSNRICFSTAAEDTYYETFRKHAYPNYETLSVKKRPSFMLFIISSGTLATGLSSQHLQQIVSNEILRYIVRKSR
jgi:hypothetical protein